MGVTADAPDGRVSIDESLWDDLLLLIEQQSVVPVVGQELLTIPGDDGPVLLYDRLAQRLSARLKVALPDSLPPAPLDFVASRFLAGGGDPRRIYLELLRLMRDLGELPPPEPLRKLAAIEPFRLFVSTTFDSLLAGALNAERFGGRPSTPVVAFSPSSPEDIPIDLEEPHRPLIYQLLGRVSPTQSDYVVTEEDALEFVHHLLFERRPARLFGQLQKRDLLIIGCSFPSWIVRFFIRAARASRLLQAQGTKMDLVVDSGACADRALVSFLRGFRTRTEVLENVGPIEFVDELHRRWCQWAPPKSEEDGSGGSRPRAFMRPGSIFLSYASEDFDAARRICSSLEEQGLDVWFDRHDLAPGDDVELRIRTNIRACSLFVPILSRSCFTRNRRFLHLEWSYAAAEARRMPPARHFIVPVVIDDLSLDNPEIPEEFQKVHVAKLRDGRLDEEAIRLIREDYRDFQKRLQGV